MIQVSVDVIQINVILNYRIFVTNFFNFKIIIVTSIFEKYFVFRAFTFNFRFDMPRGAPVREIRLRSVEENKDPDMDTVTVIPPDTAILTDFSTNLQSVNLLAYAPDGSRWILPLFVFRQK